MARQLREGFAEIAAKRKDLDAQLNALAAGPEAPTASDPRLLDRLPLMEADLERLPEDMERELFDGFQLQVRYHQPTRRVTLRVTIDGDAVPRLISVSQAIMQRAGSHAIQLRNRERPPTALAVGGPRSFSLAGSAPGRIRTCASGGDQRAGPVDPLPSVDRALLDDSACVLGIDLGDEDQMMDLVAVAMVRLAWRDGPVEDWHKEGHICNSEMMRASAATTRLVREILSGGRRGMTGGDTVSLMGETVDAVGRALVDLDRHLPDGRTLTELAPDAEQLAAFERHVWMFCTRWNRVAAKYGVQETIGLLALYSG
jgi:hypothetical protein